MSVVSQQCRVLMIGPPGAGKGTQATLIKQQYHVCHLATGDMLRAAVEAKTPLGLKAKVRDKWHCVTEG